MLKFCWRAALLTLPLAALLGPASQLTAQGSLAPPLPFEDAGACPFEGCVYREWTATAPLQAHAARRDDAPMAFVVGAGEKVVAVTGVVITARAGRVQFEESQRLSSSSGALDVRPGQTLYLLTYQGEGFTKVWFNGALYEDVDASSFMNAVCEDDPKLCSGRVVERPRSEWWVQVRNQAGQLGWTRETDKFDGKDALQ